MASASDSLSPLAITVIGQGSSSSEISFRTAAPTSMNSRSRVTGTTKRPSIQRSRVTRLAAYSRTASSMGREAGGKSPA